MGSTLVWRSVLLAPAPAGSGRDLGQGDEAPSLSWLEHILKPWFTGKAHLNAQAVSRVLQAMLAEPDVRLLGSDTSDADALLALQRYAVASKHGPRTKRGATHPSPDSLRKRWPKGGTRGAS